VDASSSDIPAPPPAPPKTTIADWTATASDDEDASYFYAEKRQRGGRKKRKKNKTAAPVTQDWDDIYDPSRPNNYEEYKHSEEKIREVREWKDLLYRRRTKRRDYSDSEDEYRPPMNSKQTEPFDEPSLT
jgi:splicing factor 45